VTCSLFSLLVKFLHKPAIYFSRVAFYHSFNSLLSSGRTMATANRCTPRIQLNSQRGIKAYKLWRLRLSCGFNAISLAFAEATARTYNKTCKYNTARWQTTMFQLRRWLGRWVNHIPITITLYCAQSMTAIENGNPQIYYTFALEYKHHFNTAFYTDWLRIAKRSLNLHRLMVGLGERVESSWAGWRLDS
jgi:hypothetical protein